MLLQSLISLLHCLLLSNFCLLEFPHLLLVGLQLAFALLWAAERQRVSLPRDVLLV